MTDVSPILQYSPEVLELKRQIVELEAQVAYDPLPDLNLSMFSDPDSAVILALQKKAKEDEHRRLMIESLRLEIERMVESSLNETPIDLLGTMGLEPYAKTAARGPKFHKHAWFEAPAERLAKEIVALDVASRDDSLLRLLVATGLPEEDTFEAIRVLPLWDIYTGSRVYTYRAPSAEHAAELFSAEFTVPPDEVRKQGEPAPEWFGGFPKTEHQFAVRSGGPTRLAMPFARFAGVTPRGYLARIQIDIADAFSGKRPVSPDDYLDMVKRELDITRPGLRGDARRKELGIRMRKYHDAQFQRGIEAMARGKPIVPPAPRVAKALTRQRQKLLDVLSKRPEEMVTLYRVEPIDLTQQMPKRGFATSRYKEIITSPGGWWTDNLDDAERYYQSLYGDLSTYSKLPKPGELPTPYPRHIVKIQVPKSIAEAYRIKNRPTGDPIRLHTAAGFGGREMSDIFLPDRPPGPVSEEWIRSLRHRPATPRVHVALDDILRNIMRNNPGYSYADLSREAGKMLKWSDTLKKWVIPGMDIPFLEYEAAIGKIWDEFFYGVLKGRAYKGTIDTIRSIKPVTVSQIPEELSAALSNKALWEAVQETFDPITGKKRFPLPEIRLSDALDTSHARLASTGRTINITSSHWGYKDVMIHEMIHVAIYDRQLKGYNLPDPSKHSAQFKEMAQLIYRRTGIDPLEHIQVPLDRFVEAQKFRSTGELLAEMSYDPQTGSLKVPSIGVGKEISKRIALSQNPEQIAADFAHEMLRPAVESGRTIRPESEVNLAKRLLIDAKRRSDFGLATMAGVTPKGYMRKLIGLDKPSRELFDAFTGERPISPDDYFEMVKRELADARPGLRGEARRKETGMIMRKYHDAQFQRGIEAMARGKPIGPLTRSIKPGTVSQMPEELYDELMREAKPVLELELSQAPKPKPKPFKKLPPRIEARLKEHARKQRLQKPHGYWKIFTNKKGETIKQWIDPADFPATEPSYYKKLPKKLQRYLREAVRKYGQTTEELRRLEQELAESLTSTGNLYRDTSKGLALDIPKAKPSFTRTAIRKTWRAMMRVSKFSADTIGHKGYTAAKPLRVEEISSILRAIPAKKVFTRFRPSPPIDFKRWGKHLPRRVLRTIARKGIGGALGLGVVSGIGWAVGGYYALMRLMREESPSLTTKDLKKFPLTAFGSAQARAHAILQSQREEMKQHIWVTVSNISNPLEDIRIRPVLAQTKQIAMQKLGAFRSSDTIAYRVEDQPPQMLKDMGFPHGEVHAFLSQPTGPWAAFTRKMLGTAAEFFASEQLVKENVQVAADLAVQTYVKLWTSRLQTRKKQPQRGRVTAVIAGDLITVEGFDEPIHLKGVEAPQRVGTAEQQALSNLLLGKQVIVVPSRTRDQWPKLNEAYVYTIGGDSINKAAVKLKAGKSVEAYTKDPKEKKPYIYYDPETGKTHVEMLTRAPKRKESKREEYKAGLILLPMGKKDQIYKWNILIRRKDGNTYWEAVFAHDLDAATEAAYTQFDIKYQHDVTHQEPVEPDIIISISKGYEKIMPWEVTPEAPISKAAQQIQERYVDKWAQKTLAKERKKAAVWAKELQRTKREQDRAVRRGEVWKLVEDRKLLKEQQLKLWGIRPLKDWFKGLVYVPRPGQKLVYKDGVYRGIPYEEGEWKLPRARKLEPWEKEERKKLATYAKKVRKHMDEHRSEVYRLLRDENVRVKSHSDVEKLLTTFEGGYATRPEEEAARLINKALRWVDRNVMVPITELGKWLYLAGQPTTMPLFHDPPSDIHELVTEIVKVLEFVSSKEESAFYPEPVEPGKKYSAKHIRKWAVGRLMMRKIPLTADEKASEAFDRRLAEAEFEAKSALTWYDPLTGKKQHTWATSKKERRSPKRPHEGLFRLPRSYRYPEIKPWLATYLSYEGEVKTRTVYAHNAHWALAAARLLREKEPELSVCEIMSVTEL